jgi:NitT/TauT family transport system permease protein
VVWRGVIGILAFFAVWQLARWLGLMAVMPSPVEVAKSLPKQVAQEGYWLSWALSTQRVFLGFFSAAVLAIGFGIAMGIARNFRDIGFPILEILRPIPPLAWLPLSILFWPSPEMTMIFLTFMGAFFPIFINVLSGIDNIDSRYMQAARSLGSSPRTLFWRVLVPGALPSMFTGLTIAIGITWEVVIAAEMASGNHGLGYLTWNAYMSNSLTGIVVGMLSIGLAGMISSGLMGWLGRSAMPWRRRR